jgi:two-component system, OmpR family, sensor kinase
MAPPPTSDLQVLRLVAHELRAHLTVLNDISAHLVDAVDDGRRRTGLPLALAEVDLSGAAREALAMAGEVARRHHVALRLDDRRLGAAPVRGDRFQLVVAMRNLLDNACSHGPDGDTVTLEVGRGESDVYIRTRDQGPGLEVLGSRAFAARRHRGARPPDGGLGLGLSLVAEVARAHGGQVTWGRDEQGATIGLRFPDRSHT